MKDNFKLIVDPCKTGRKRSNMLFFISREIIMKTASLCISKFSILLLFVFRVDGDTCSEATCIAKVEPVNIIVIGDWGGMSSPPYATQVQTDVALQMQKYSRLNEVSFVLSTGDNFYPFGLNSSVDKRFAYTYENVYLRESLKNTPWFVCLGNHDHRNENGRHQLSYGTSNSLWNIPDYFYEVRISIKSSQNRAGSVNKTAKFIFIDTTLLCNLHDQRKGKRDFVNQRHYRWLDNRLNDSQTDDYLFVVGHHPIVSQMSGRRPSHCLSSNINPLLMMYKVSAYLSGHDHTLQHNRMYNKVHNHLVHYFVSGAGASTYARQNKGSSDTGSLFYWAEMGANGGFMTFSLTTSHIAYEFRTKNGTVIYSGRIRYLKRYQSN
jgi:tartrate-resistant acid phosphatase type 5